VGGNGLLVPCTIGGGQYQFFAADFWPLPLPVFP